MSRPAALPMSDSRVSVKADGSSVGEASLAKFQPCLNQGTHNDAIVGEASTTPHDATGTPSVFVNGKFVGDPSANLVPSYDQIAALIDTALASPTPKPS